MQTFVDSILSLSPSASIIVAGDMNEYMATRAVFRPLAALLHDINDVGGVPPEERYTYAYDEHAQEIDHMFVSDAVAARGGAVEHVHVNTWARSIGERASDHDPTVGRVWVCDAEAVVGGGIGESRFPVSCARLRTALTGYRSLGGLGAEREQIVL